MDKKRILLVDDEGSFAKLLKMNLEQTGVYEAQVETQGALALQAARQFKPDLLLLDVIMPDIDGGSVAAQFQADDELREIPIVFLTAIVTKQEEITHDGVLGRFPFLAKPVDTGEVIACIEKYTGGSR